jgi:hypothetical protein
VRNFWKKICLHKKKKPNPSLPDVQGARILFQKIKHLHLCKLEVGLPICKVIMMECKVSTSPSLNRGFWNAMNDLKIKESWIIAPVKDTYPLENGVRVAPLQNFIDILESLKH